MSTVVHPSDSQLQTSSTSAQPKARLPVHVHHSGSSFWIPKATSTLRSAFENDPVTAYMLNYLPPPARPAALQKLFRLSNNAAIIAGGELWSASTEDTPSAPSFHAAATIFPPTTSIDNLGARSLPSLLLSGALAPALWTIGPSRLTATMNEFSAATTPAKKATFNQGESYYYIQLIGASAAHRGKGLAPALIRNLQERASGEGKPIWLEASNEGARKVYLKLGFEVVLPEIRLGVGECDVRGERAEGEDAVGVPMWPMVWWPEGSGRGSRTM
ncbi:hypothetical protein EKO04_010776 [Ascochyta lentis]|uniref:N-acetyltransferase domain-containing protein n=1 Tax=Ascochyta lentis TaxID=205686 RepID=A0A8H7MFG6_9PLEO|nr:hypothetical protein EKO04_010776 [Ascochyta lentis]